MLSSLKNALLAGVLVLAAAASVPAAAVAQGGTRTFRIVNETRYTIQNIYVSPTDDSYWGDDLLGNQVLRTDYRFDISVVPGWYDVKIVDEDGDACTLKNIDFRYGDTWKMTDGLLVACELFTSN